ncbi:papilin-like [Dysidea avara]|uniref:papilin-like n=1 Tax=Dysidea avara TaxID=196820 RepID=UPI003333134E
MDCFKQLLIFSILVSIADMVSGGESWSPCSRTCGVGIMYRTISCQNDGCNDTRKEFQACNVKRCPGDNADFRSEQCKTFGEQLIPFINKTDPCKLLCSSPGQKLVENGLVVDGTSCLSSGVCVDGECVSIGCDGVLGSKKTTNKCGKCCDLCIQLPCKLENCSANGYHTVLPSESRNISIVLDTCDFKAISNSTKSHQCNSSHSDISISGTLFTIANNELTAEGPLQSPVTIEIHCPSYKIQCNYHMSVHDPYEFRIPILYEWARRKNFTPCSQTCGRGIQIQEIYCHVYGSNTRVSDLECLMNSERLSPTIRFCDQPACPSEWMHSDWTQCSKSCGGGNMTRNVSCIQVYRDEVEPIQTPGNCDNETKPESQDECNNHPCHNHWNTGDWSRCSVDCGEGIQRRNVTCRDANGNKIHRDNCSLLAKPHTERSCAGNMCIHKWIKSNWTNCSVSCGEGVQTRHVNCTENGTIVDDIVCLENIPDSKPVEERTCQGPFCNGTWVVESWPKECVTSRCGEAGVRYRNVHCIYNGKTAKEHGYIKCNPTKEPSHTQTCYKTEGCHPEWHTSDWNSCSKTCDGIQTRTLHCKVGNATLPDERCPSNTKPIVVQACSPKCPFTAKCLMEFCHKHSISPCQKECCNQCEQMIPSLPPLARHMLCDRPCCTGTLSWKKKGACTDFM